MKEKKMIAMEMDPYAAFTIFVTVKMNGISISKFIFVQC